MGFPSSSIAKESAYNAGDLGSIPGSKRSPGEGNGNPLQYPCLENSMDRGAWKATVHGGHKNSDPTEPVTLTHITRLVFKIGLGPIHHISIENISMYFFTSKNIT